MRRPHATDPGRARFWRHSASSRRAPENPEIQTKIAEHEAHGTKQRPEHVRQHRDNIARIARIVSPPWKGPKIGPPDPPHYDAAELACWVCAADGTSTRSVPVSRASELHTGAYALPTRPAHPKPVRHGRSFTIGRSHLQRTPCVITTNRALIPAELTWRTASDARGGRGVFVG